MKRERIVIRFVINCLLLLKVSIVLNTSIEKEGNWFGETKRNKIHREEFNELVETISHDFKENELRGSLDNSTQTLTALENDNGEVMLVPSVTFIGQYSTKDSDESIPMTFDIPTDASLVPANKAIVSR